MATKARSTILLRFLPGAISGRSEKALNKKSLNVVSTPSTRKSLPMMQPVQQGEIDPVCGMTVQPATAAGSYEYGGKKYYFCATRCLDKFCAEPDYYLIPPEQRKPKATPASVGGAVKYVCPMDPEVSESKPGACQSAGWLWSRRMSPRCRLVPSIPAPCIRRSCSRTQAIARFVGWR